MTDMPSASPLWRSTVTAKPAGSKPPPGPLPVPHRQPCRVVNEGQCCELVDDATPSRIAARNEAFHEGGNGGFDVAHHHEIEKGRDGLGVRNNADSPGDDERGALPPLPGEDRDFRPFKHFHDIGIVELEGEGEEDDLEGGKGPGALQRDKRPAFLVEKPFAHHIIPVVQRPVEDVRRKVRHPHVIGIGENDENRYPAPPFLADGTLFPEKKVRLVVIPSRALLSHCSNNNNTDQVMGDRS